ncbi:hypothetical protein PoB_006671500 [Plakobranchus ocellatus]|uniref:Uncharacterized protein n=1 Tax=Plakobranchus ocellatus TaxID=259542 RepID=A0AAV4D7W0_9GAST|nr:hypothetical protein PoB_006671500 [Plakobranchus ocellatus]
MNSIYNLQTSELFPSLKQRSHIQNHQCPPNWNHIEFISQKEKNQVFSHSSIAVMNFDPRSVCLAQRFRFLHRIDRSSSDILPKNCPLDLMRSGSKCQPTCSPHPYLSCALGCPLM